MFTHTCLPRFLYCVEHRELEKVGHEVPRFAAIEFSSELTRAEICYFPSKFSRDPGLDQAIR